MSAKSIRAYEAHLAEQGRAPEPLSKANEAALDAIRLLDKAAAIIAQADELAASARALGATPVLLSYYSSRRATGE